MRKIFMDQPVYAVTRKGFVLFSVVLTMMLIIVGAAVAVSISGLNAASNADLLVKSYQANGLVNACIEEALAAIKQNQSFAGTGNLTLGAGSCSYTVQLLAGESRDISVSANVGTVVRKGVVQIDAINPEIHVVKWQEVAD